jgi:hypothetical protein
MAAPLADPVFPVHGTQAGPDGSLGDVDDPLPRDPLPRLRRICLGLPEVTERISHGAPAWFVRGRTSFGSLWQHGHHQYDFPHLVLAAPPGGQAELVAAAPERFFRPPYVGHRGWVGIRLDLEVDWDELAELCRDAYRSVAPARLVAQLDSRGGGPAGGGSGGGPAGGGPAGGGPAGGGSGAGPGAGPGDGGVTPDG